MMNHPESVKVKVGGLMFGFIALVTLALSLWSFYDDRTFFRDGKRVMGTVMVSKMRRTRDRVGQEPKWRNYLLVAYEHREDWFHVPGHVASAYKKGSQIEVFYSFTQTKFRAELVPTMGLTKYYLLAVSIASMVACIGMLIWAKRMRRDEDEPDVPSLEEALRRAI